MESLTLFGLNEQFWIEDIEQTLREVANAVIDRQHNNQRHGTHHNATQRYPRDTVDDAFLLARK